MDDKLFLALRKHSIYVHFFVGQKKYAMRRIYNAPRVGDEVRFNRNFFTVKRLVWAYDENEERLNIELEPAD